MTHAKNRSVNWMLLAILALAPTAAVAQQAAASQGQKQQNQLQPEAAQPKTEAAKPQPEAAQPNSNEETNSNEDGKLIAVPGSKALGMSILGNQEAPKALVIVPWKSSELGNGVGISTQLDDSRLPIDKEVFMRVLNYYEIRSEPTRTAVAPAKTNAAQPTAALRRKQ